MSRPSLLSRLFLLLGMLGVGFLVLAFYLYRGTERLLTAELHAGLAGDLEWMAAHIESDPGLVRFPRADSLAKAIAARKHFRVTIIGEDGDVVGESQVPREQVRALESHAERAEVAAARRAWAAQEAGDTVGPAVGFSRRFSPTTGHEMYYVAKVLGPQGPVLRIAAGPATLDSFTAIGLRTALVALLLFLAAGAVIALWVSRRISRPLLRLRDAARDVSKPLRWDAPFREAEILNGAFVDYAEAVQKLTAEVRMERDRLLALLDRLEEGVVLLDGRGRIRAVNASARNLLPLRDPSAPLAGLVFRDAVTHEGLGRWASAAPSQPLREGVFQVDKGRDSPADLLCHLRALQHGARGEMLLTLVDVTSFRNLDRAKTDFVANASHELKTPLSSILGYAETLLEGAQDNSAARGPFLQKIHANALRLQGLVQDLLNLSQLESKGPSHIESLRVRDFVQAAWNQNRAPAEGRGIRFENRVPPEIHWTMEPRDLDLILGNLVGNAVKYNAPGGKVWVEWDPATRMLGVRDTGAGIPGEALPRIFERFYRGGVARAGNEGTGLGLAIVKHAAQRYGIEVSAESTPGDGSRFVLEIPGKLMTDGRQ